MRDELFSMGHRTGQLLDLQREMQGYWNDAMSQDIHRRYLDPHESSSKDMLFALKRQQDSLDNSAHDIKKAEAHMNNAGKASAEMEQHQKYSHGELNKAQKYTEQMYKFESKALEEIKLVLSLIDKANKAGM